ncbi:transporter substrate-binding domain-containing protein [Vibrio sp. SCSIO 43135]|uniref:Transporter substrate-binding domain-containing protein n=1 Tax=Vibrio paucivorans TaxID=2829489 RepID=A0A9X3HRK9_9VIBR|nr:MULTISPECIES: transporter substrate-binding domain-containing protein [Vibrio]MCW8334225.1 transporter substrate-binding domain-containing protein [Vibrio paucivorans]USD43459.1 transporter substrate-binding domain-containing protein [Vibrio sp. SCSIO 43135]
MRLLITLFIAALLSFTSQAATITAAQDPWPPFVQKDKSNPGISVEIVTAAFASQGHDVNFKIMPWTRALNEVKEGRIDVLVATWFTQERTSYLNYSDSYLENSLKFIKKAGDGFEYSGLDSLSGKSVGIIRNYGYGDEFLGATNFNKPEANDLISNVKKLKAGRIDLTLEDEVVAKATISGAGMNVSDFSFTSSALSVNPIHVTSGLANSKNAEIIDAFNKGLAAIKADGTFDKILMKYGIK